MQNGRWFDGRQFRARTFYVVAGLLQQHRPAHIDSVVDLAGQWVVPAFGDAHNHAVDQQWKASESITQYLTDGIFYLKNPNNIPRYTAPLAPLLNRPGSLDVTYSGGGITASGGHPIPLYEALVARGVYQIPPDQLNGQAYHTLDSLAQWPAVWRRVAAGQPDFVKLYLLFSDRYGQPHDTTKATSAGLNPRLLPELVGRIHAQGLPVAVHLETAADFAVALQAGVDEINHMPGYYWDKHLRAADYCLTPALAQQCARQGTRVVTTTFLTHEQYATGQDTLQRQLIQQLQRENLSCLYRAGVQLSLGSDTYGQTARAEMLNLLRLRVFDNATLLRLWAENTPQAVFPGRRIGRLRQGYEANLLVLGQNPLTNDFATATADIRLRIKQGQILRLPSPPPQKL
ncbi:amidohydrolase family protein [Hymenobacter psychrophilus]|uniref:amidohydrolase family protein n=1 Tax=Hymenobacter psychrophilus TaxID=651662 RepID=UPI001587D0A5|nr:amidohydrolase family protein [Hymenobacter psychrophilus]